MRHNTVLLIREKTVLLLNSECVGFMKTAYVYNIRAWMVGEVTMVVDYNEKKISPRG